MLHHPCCLLTCLLCFDTDISLSNYRTHATLLHKNIKPTLQEYCESCKNKELVNGISKASLKVEGSPLDHAHTGHFLTYVTVWRNHSR